MCDNRQPLTQEDIDALKELCGSLIECTDIGDQAEIILTIREIVNNEPMGIVEIKPEDCKPTPNMRLWGAYVWERIRRWCHARAWTVEELEKRSGLPMDYIRRLESGEAIGTEKALTEIAAAFGLTYEQLIPFKWEEE